MKKITLLSLAVLALSLASCKKDRTCICTYSNAGSSNTETQITTYKNVTSKSALATCSSGTSYNQDEPSKFETRTCALK